MPGFELDQIWVRILVSLAFVVAAVLVLSRVAYPVPVAAGHCGAGDREHDSSHESDAAHLLMCVVMFIMVLFPEQAHGPAMHGVLLAMTLVFTLLLVEQIAYRKRAPRIGALAYHVVAAGAMLFAMSGHSSADHTAGPGSVSVLVLAVVFVADAVAVTVAARRGGRGFWAIHSAGRAPGRGVPLAVLPHLIMNLGMAYMLITAALN